MYAIQTMMMTSPYVRTVCIVSSTVNFKPVASQIFLDGPAQFLHTFLTFEPRGVAGRDGSTFHVVKCIYHYVLAIYMSNYSSKRNMFC